MKMKNKTTAGIFALVFGGLGVHRFYLGQPGKGLLYLLFVWTFIPTIIAMIDGIIFLTQDEDKFDRKYNPEMWTRRQDQEQGAYQQGYNPPPPPPRQVYAPEPTRGPKKDPFQLSADQKYADYDFDGAIQDYRRSLNVDPRQADVHFKLACLYSIHENTDTAIYHLSQALEHGITTSTRSKSTTTWPSFGRRLNTWPSSRTATASRLPGNPPSRRSPKATTPVHPPKPWSSATTSSPRSSGWPS